MVRLFQMQMTRLHMHMHADLSALSHSDDLLRLVSATHLLSESVRSPSSWKYDGDQFHYTHTPLLILGELNARKLHLHLHLWN